MPNVKAQKRIIILLMIFLLAFLQIAAAHASQHLVVSSGIADDIVIPMFQLNHPGIKLTIDPIAPLYSEMVNRFINRDAYIDLYRLNSNLGIHQHVRSKGFFYDLSVDKTIKTFISRLAEPFQSQIVSEGKILGVPSFLILEYPMIVNQGIAKEIGLDDDDLPTNLLDLLKFVNDWDEKYGDAFPEYFPFRADKSSSYALAHRNPYIGLVLEMYKDTLVTQGQPLRYDTPLFYDLLNEIKDWTYNDDQTYEAQMESMPDQEHCLFYSFQAFDSEILTLLCGNGSYINMPLSIDTPIVQAYELECAIVNPETKSPDLAVELARCYAQDCQPALLRLLCADENDPYQAPDYQQHLEELQDWREQEARVYSTAPQEKKKEHQELLSMIDKLIQYISEKAMKEYRASIAPYLVARGEGIYESEAIYAETMAYTLCWLDGDISMEEYAKGLDDFLRLAVLEDT